MVRSRMSLWFVLLLPLAGLALGCEKPLPPMGPVSGKVTVDGKPVTSGQVSLVPLEVKDDAGAFSAGEIDSGGNYTIHTAGQTGAPLGKYRFTVTPSMVPAPGATKPPETPYAHKYSDRNASPLVFDVVQNPASGAYDLKLTPK